MRRNFLCVVAVVFAVAAAVETASAQIVQVGPGYVRAPFVRVYRGGDGGAHVQAPFVNRYVPGRYANRWDRDPRDPAVRGDLRQMPDARVQRQLFGAALDLDAALGRFETGDSWRNYLKVGSGLALSRDRFDEIEQARGNGELAALLARYDAVSKNPDFRMISSLPAFQWTHELLAEYARRTPRTAPAEELPPPQPE